MTKFLDRFPVIMCNQLLRRSEEAGYDVWPAPIFHPAEVSPYICKYLFPRLYRDIQILLKKGYSEELIAKFFPYPSRIARITYLYHAFPASNLPLKDALDLAELLLRLISYHRSDVFLESGKNIILQEKQVKALIKEYNLKIYRDKKDLNELQSMLGKLIVLLINYLELIYFCHQHIGLEIHGPYNLDGKLLLVRDFYDIKPPYWNFCNNLRYNRILLLTVYKDVEIDIDYAGRLYSKETLKDKLVGIQLSTEPEINLDIKGRINQLINDFQDIIKHGILHVTQCDKGELMKKFGEGFFYSTKPIRDKLGMRWDPPQDFYQDIENGIFNKYFRNEIESLHLSELPLSEKEERLKKFWDIRSKYNLKGCYF